MTQTECSETKHDAPVSPVCPRCGEEQAGRMGSYMCGTYQCYATDKGPLRLVDKFHYSAECGWRSKVRQLEASLAAAQGEVERLKGEREAAVERERFSAVQIGLLAISRFNWMRAYKFLDTVISEGTKRGRPMDIIDQMSWKRKLDWEAKCRETDKEIAAMSAPEASKEGGKGE